MNARIFWRVFWKEARTGAGLWVAMAAGGAILAGLHRWSFVWQSRTTASEADATVFGLALLFAALYAAACGGTIFSVERESGTFHFLQALPVAAWKIVLAKTLFAAAATAALFAALWGVATAICQASPSWKVLGGLALIWSVASAQSLAWGVFFSLCLRRPIAAVLLAMTAASVCVNGLAILFGNRSGQDFESYVLSMPWSALVVAAVAAADVLLARRWFRERTPLAGWLPRRRAALPKAAGAGRRARLPGFGRLVWQEARESVVPMAALLLFILAVQGGFARAMSDVFGKQRDSVVGMFVLVLLACILFSTLAGSMVFLADWRQNRFRFLAERGVGPRTIWLSRLVVWAVPLAVAMATLFGVLFVGLTGMSRRVFIESMTHDGFVAQFVENPQHMAELLLAPGLIGCGLVVAGIGFALGQFWSMRTRSGIVAAAAAVASTSVLAWWAGMMVYLNVPWLWSVAPLAPVLLLATWLDAPDWLLERTGWRRLRRAACVGTPVVAILVAVPLWRAYSVPLVEPGFSVEEYLRPDTPEEKATLELYSRAAQSMAPRGPEEPSDKRSDEPVVVSWDPRPARWRAQAEASPRAVELALQASRQKACGRPSDVEVVWHSTNLLRASGELELAGGRLDAARERFLGSLRVASHLRRGDAVAQLFADSSERWTLADLRDWAVAAGQTPQRIKTALDELAAIAEARPPRSDAAKATYVWGLRVIEGDPATCTEEMLHETRWVRRLPWERERAIRMLNVITSQAIAWCERLDMNRRDLGNRDDWLRSRGPIATPRLMEYFDWDLAAGLDGQERGIEQFRRFTNLFLAVEAWRLGHGRRPDSPAELVGPYLESVPIDPVTGVPFPYNPASPLVPPPEDRR